MFNNIFNKIFLDSKFCLISLFITSFIISLLFSINIDQRALNAALIISNKINYSNELNVLNLNYHNSWTIIFQILRISIELGVNIKFLSFFILFTSILLNAFGIYLVSKSISQNNFFSIITPAIIRFSSVDPNRRAPTIPDTAYNTDKRFGLIGVYCKKSTNKAESSRKNLTFKQ